MKVSRFFSYLSSCSCRLAEYLNMNQLTVYQKLKESGILTGYIIPAYDVLHTYSGQYIVDDLVSYMKEKGVL